MVPKFFVNSSCLKKEVSFKKNKFIVYKSVDNSKISTTLNNNNNLQSRNIKFLITKIKESRKFKIIKNNKLVFDNFNNTFNFFDKDKNTKPDKKYKKFLRRSSYRGVSKNGKNWQVLLSKNNINYYLGNYSSEENAAKIYDIFNIYLRGTKAITNYFYDNETTNHIYEYIRNITSTN